MERKEDSFGYSIDQMLEEQLGALQENPIFKKAREVIDSLKSRNKKVTSQAVKQQLGDAIEEYLRTKMGENTITSVRVKDEQGDIVQDIELDGYNIDEHKIISIKAKKKAQKPKRDIEMWAKLVTTIENGGTITVEKVDAPEYNDIIEKGDPEWEGISFDEDPDCKLIWDKIDEMATQ